VTAELDFFNVFTATYEPMENEYFRGSGAGAKILYRSQDGRHLAVATQYPNGVRFRYGGTVSYKEVFYVVRGHGHRTFPDGTSVEMIAGDVIYVKPGIEIDYVYDPGFMDVAFFWSDSGPLDPFLAGTLAKPIISD
jgi:mannose-6-phosphate isomerase-like protein (cupin superfamily)